MARTPAACRCRKCGLDHAAPPNPAWRPSAPASGWITATGADGVARRVFVVEVDAFAVRDFLPAPDPRA